MKKIGIYTGSRADYSILKNLIIEIQKKKNIQAKLYVGGGHVSKKSGETYKEIINDKIKIDFLSKIKIKKTGNVDILRFISDSIKEYTKTLNKHKPELIVVLGDRYEAYAFTMAAFFLNIKIAHIHGGELTQGAFDDCLRHSISKLSNFHFVTHKSYQKRLIQLGEEKKNIFLVGSLGVQNYVNTNKLSKKELYIKYNIPFGKKILLATFHPETRGKIKTKEQIKIFISALSFYKNIFIIFTYNNLDSDGLYFAKCLEEFNKINKNSMIIKSMGSNLYYNFIKNVDLVIGNSSSGIIEVPEAKTATLDIGDRQLGRIKSASVFSCKLNKIDIILSINKILKKKNIVFKNVYKQKKTKENITSNLIKILYKGKQEQKKFNDIEFKY